MYASAITDQHTDSAADMTAGFRKIEQRVWPPTTSFGAGWSTSSVSKIKLAKLGKPFQHKRKVVMSEKIKVGILGATGMVGQRFVTLLENHQWF